MTQQIQDNQPSADVSAEPSLIDELSAELKHSALPQVLSNEAIERRVDQRLAVMERRQLQSYTRWLESEDEPEEDNETEIDDEVPWANTYVLGHDDDPDEHGPAFYNPDMV